MIAFSIPKLAARKAASFLFLTFWAFAVSAQEQGDNTYVFAGGNSALAALANTAARASVAPRQTTPKPSHDTAQTVVGWGKVWRNAPEGAGLPLGLRVQLGVLKTGIDWPDGIGILSNPVSTRATLLFADARRFADISPVSGAFDAEIGIGAVAAIAISQTSFYKFTLKDQALTVAPFAYARASLPLLNLDLGNGHMPPRGVGEVTVSGAGTTLALSLEFSF